MNVQTSQPKGGVKTIWDFMKFGVILSIFLLIGIVLYGRLTGDWFLSIAGSIADGGGDLPVKVYFLLFIFIYASLMSFIKYRSSVSNHKTARVVLKLLDWVLILGFGLIILLICMPTSM